MRTFLVFLGLLALAVLISGFLAVPAWRVVNDFAAEPIHRVAERVGMLIFAIATIAYLHRRGLTSWGTLGYGIQRERFLRQMFLGFFTGVLLMLPLVACALGFGLRHVSADFLSGKGNAIFFGELMTQGLLSGFAVAFIEETFCRGILFGTIKRESGLVLAIVLPAFFYSATHFMDGRLTIAADQVTYMTGFRAIFAMFQPFTVPLQHLDAFLALAVLGVLLALIRIRTGAIAAGVGVHAGGAWVIWVFSGISTANPLASLAWMAGSYRGIIGWMACGWFCVIAAGYWWTIRNGVGEYRHIHVSPHPELAPQPPGS